MCMTKLLPGVRREDLAPARDPDEGMHVARVATQRLKDAYADRLVDVVIFGSWVRGEAHEESDVDLLVVLDGLDDRALERNHIVDEANDPISKAEQRVDVIERFLASARMGHGQ